MKKGWVVTIILMVVIYACKHEVVNPTTTTTTSGGTGSVGTGGAGGGQQSSVVCFEAEILPIFRNTCAKSGCHNAASANKGYVFETYEGIRKGVEPGDLHESKIYRMITEDDTRKRMPRNAPRLSDTVINLIARWIKEGAKNTTNCASACDTSVFTYAAVVKPIIDANCVSCHNGPSAPKGLDYTTHAG